MNIDTIELRRSKNFDARAGVHMQTEASPESGGLAVGCCQPLGAPALTREEAEATAALFRALADPSRVRIVNLLSVAGRAVCVCDLTEPLGLAQPTVSHHLKKLFSAGLLEREQRGTWAYYSLDLDAMRRLADVASLEGAAHEREHPRT